MSIALELPCMTEAEDINDAVRREWIEETDGFDRIRDVMRNATEPLTASDVAERAEVSANTARKHLDRLAEMNRIGTDERGNTKLYFRDESREKIERVRKISRKYTEEEIQERIREMTSEIHDYREGYGCEEPEDLVVGADEDTDSEVWEIISEWKTTRANLAVAKAALAFKRVPARSGDGDSRVEV
jgi:DNA-binding transcriptional ArsR family regulator